MKRTTLKLIACVWFVTAHAQDPSSALLEKANNGDLQAQMSVAQAYQYGLGADKDKEKAIHWYTAAAMQQNPAAMYELGNLVYSDVDPEDKSDAALEAANKSVAWFSQSAKLGHPQAQSTLGLLFGFGDRVERNKVTGRMWLEVAQSNGFDPSKTLLGMLEDQMSKDERALAIAAAEKCITSNYTDCN